MKSQSIVQRHLDSAQILTVKAGTMNHPRASCGVSKNIYESFPEVVTPECLIGVQSEFRLDSCYKHAGMTDFEGTRNPVCAASCGELIQ